MMLYGIWNKRARAWVLGVNDQPVQLRRDGAIAYMATLRPAVDFEVRPYQP
jgi:hypothetical protein